MTVTATSINLSWSAPAGGGAVTAYTVLYRITGSGAFAILTDPVSGTSYTATGLVPTTSYDFAVFARNGAGPGGLSGIVTQATLGDIPYSPASLAAAAGAPPFSAVGLSWTAPGIDSTHGPAASYTVSYRPGNTGAWTVAQSGVTGTSATVSGLAHNALYGFKIDAVNGAGMNISGATATLTTDYAPPNVPAIGGVAPVNDGSTTKLAATWSPPATDGTHDAATGYNLRYSVHAANTWTMLAAVSSGAVITGLSAGTSYDVQVQATNGSTTSPGAWSASTTASTYATGFAVVAPTVGSSFTHGSYPVTQVTVTGSFTTIQGIWGASPSLAPASGWTAFYSYSGMMVQYLGGAASASPGTVYLWVQALNGSGQVIGCIEAGSYTVT